MYLLEIGKTFQNAKINFYVYTFTCNFALVVPVFKAILAIDDSRKKIVTMLVVCTVKLSTKD